MKSMKISPSTYLGYAVTANIKLYGIRVKSHSITTVILM